ncbi:MAG TPA: dihydrodipicolinate synthase family protein, partial [Solirubrobacteraceae bacterium]
RETAAGRLRLFAHTAFGTLDDNLLALRLAEREGADLVLLSYPPQFWPTTDQEIYDWTRAVCDATELGVMLFGLPAWGFERIHPAGMPVSFVRHVLDTIPNIVAIKAEQGNPFVAGTCEMYYHFRDEVVISCPIEADAIPLMGVMDMQFSGTSNTQWMSDWFPRTFDLARRGQYPEAMERYWQVHPARLAASAAMQAYIGGTTVLNRTMWKYQDWLAGYNGGPLRHPALRIPDRFMKSLRAGLATSGLPVTTDPDGEFMIGRNPA